jgi:hypothetical protein
MHAILAISARHIQEAWHPSQNHPQYDFKVLEAHHFQKTLSNFSDTFSANIHSNQDAVLATSFLLFFHACSALDINTSPARPCEDASFTFLRGIRSIVANGSHIAHGGPFKALVDPPLLLPILFPRAVPFTGPGALFISLLGSLPPFSPFLENRQIYIERIESLTLYLYTPTAQDLGAEAVEEFLLSYLRWQAFCPTEFVSLVKAHDAIALIILAHYYAAVGFILPAVKDRWWWWQNKPRCMVHAIGEYIGPAWTAWMEWPRAVVQGSR